MYKESNPVSNPLSNETLGDLIFTCPQSDWFFHAVDLERVYL